jgi:hypothetical protein
VNVEFEGRTWALDTARISFKHAMGIQSHTGMAIGDWQNTVTGMADDGQGGITVEMKPEWLPAIGALYWLMRMQDGSPVPFDDIDFEVTPFYNAFLNALSAEITKLLAEQKAKKAAADADPTGVPEPSPPDGPPSPAPSLPTPTLARPPAEAATGS